MTLEAKMQQALDWYSTMYPGCKSASLHLMTAFSEDGKQYWRASTASGIGVAATPASAVDELLVAMRKHLDERFSELKQESDKSAQSMKELTDIMDKLKTTGAP